MLCWAAEPGPAEDAAEYTVPVGTLLLAGAAAPTVRGARGQCVGEGVRGRA